MKWRIALVSTAENAAYGAGHMCYALGRDWETAEFDTKEAAEKALEDFSQPHIKWMGYVIPADGGSTES